MNWDDLRFVLAVSRAGTLSGAAAALKVTHTTVGRRLSTCEKLLGVRLFDRTPEGFFPTPAGSEVIETAEQVESTLLTLEGNIMGRDTELRGSLYVSTLDMLYRRVHGGLMRFMTSYPHVDVTLTTNVDPVSLTRREADVAIRMTDKPPEGLIGLRVGEVTFGVFVSRALYAQMNSSEDVGAYPWLRLDKRQPNDGLESWFKVHAPNAHVVARVDENAMLAREMVTRGVGAFFLPVEEGEDMGLQRISQPHQEPTVGLWLLTLPQLRRTGRVRAFLDCMVESFKS